MAEGQRTIRIRFTGETRGLIVSAKGAETALDRLQDRAMNGFERMVSGGAALALKLSSVASGLQLAAAGGAALATASGALLAAPAAAAAYATVLGAVKLGQEGAARAGERFLAAIGGVKAAVSSSYERALNPAADKAAFIVGKLQKPMQGIVTQLGGMATQAANTAALPRNMAVLNTVATGTERMLGNLKKAVAPLTQAFIDLVSVAAPGIRNVGAGAGAAAQRFADWIKSMKDSGELAARFAAAKDVLAQIGAVLADIGGIVAGVFRGITSGAGGVGGALAAPLDMLNRFVNSVQGQELLSSLGRALSEIGTAVSSVLGPALVAVSPLVGPLATLFASVTTAVSDLLVPLIDFLAPGLAAVAGWIERNTTWLTPLAVALGIVTGAVWLLNMALAANPILLVISVIGLLIIAFASLWQRSEGFRNFFINAWQAIRNAVGAVVDWVRDRWNGLIDAFGSAVDRVASIGRNIGEGIKSGFKSAVNFCVDMLNRLIQVANMGIGGLNMVPGVNIPHIPNIPRLARGGTLTAGGLAMVGERGRELVSLPAGARVHSNADTEALLGGGTPEIRVFIGDTELRGLVRVEMSAAAGQAARRVGARSGGAW